MLNEIITWDVEGIIHLCSQLQVIDFFYIICRNIILQFCLSLVLDFLQMVTTNSVNKVNSNNFKPIYLITQLKNNLFSDFQF